MIWTGWLIGIVSAAQIGATQLTGRVVDEGSGAPLVGAIVSLVDLGRHTRTSSDGRYAFSDVPAGPQHVVVRFLGHTPRSLHALVPGAGSLELDLRLVQAPQRLPTLTVAPEPALPLPSGADDKGPADRLVSHSALRQSPMLIEPDAFLSLGGGWVRAAPESPDGLHVRGGSSDQVAYLLDGIPVFNPYHAAGVFAGWNPDAIASVDLASSQPNLWSPHALSATVNGVLRSPSNRVEVQGATTTTHSRVTTTGPIASSGAGFLFSGRTGYPGLLARAGDGSIQRGRTQDWLGMLEIPTFGGRARLIGFASEDELDTQAFADLSGHAPLDPRRNGFEWGATSLGATWERDVRGTAWKGAAWSARGGSVSEWLAREGPVSMGSARNDIGAELVRVRQAASARTSWGLRTEGIRTRYDVGGGHTPTQRLNLRGRRWIGTALAEHDREINGSLRLRTGSAAAVTQGRLVLSPHARLQYNPLPSLTLSAAWRRSHQFAQSLRNTESLTGNVFPADLFLASGVGAMPIARTDQGVLAASIRAGGVQVNAQGYARTMNGLALVAPVSAEPFATGGFAVGTGVARGASIDVGLTRRRWTATASYGAQFVEYTADSLRYVPDHGARHLMEAGVILFPTASSSIRVGLAAEAGRRTTLSSGAFEWEACNLKDRACEFGGSPRADGVLGGTTLPGYSRVDLGIQKHWHVARAGRDGRVSLFGAFTNVIGRRNVLTLAADPVTGRRAGVEMRPQSPLVIGLDWKF